MIGLFTDGESSSSVGGSDRCLTRKYHERIGNMLRSVIICWTKPYHYIVFSRCDLVFAPKAKVVNNSDVVRIKWFRIRRLRTKKICEGN